MDTNLLIQYILVALLLIAVCVWTFRRRIKHKKRNDGCCGCSMSRICHEKQQSPDSCTGNGSDAKQNEEAQ
ncbi:MAG TPA: hypothetical protein DC009_02255 [Porphyromonadaceae bacterium]|nr:hypothetical protein [Porphyromonadaceae bacterium]